MDALNIIMALIVFLLMLGLGASVQLDDVRQHLRCRPRKTNSSKLAFLAHPVLIGFCCQYLIMPLTAFLIASLFKAITGPEGKGHHFNDAYCIGLLLTGCMPGGSTSNLLCYFGNADVGLSIMMTLCSTALAFGMAPLVLLIYSPAFTSDSISIDYVAVLSSLLLVLVPASIGSCVRNWDKIGGGSSSTTGASPVVAEGEHGAPGPEAVPPQLSHCAVDSESYEEGQHAVAPETTTSSPTDGGGKPTVRKHVRVALLLEWIAAKIGVAFIAAAIVFGAIQNDRFLDRNLWACWVTSGLLAPCGAALGYGLSGLAFRLREDAGAQQDDDGSAQKNLTRIRRAITVETGAQNSTLAVTIILAGTWTSTAESAGGKSEDDFKDDLVVVPLIYTVLTLAWYSGLVFWWRRKDRVESEAKMGELSGGS